jgi:ribosomal protein S18 acetylase RimI-like enzyme
MGHGEVAGLAEEWKRRVQAITLKTFSDEHFEGVKALWRECFPGDPRWNDAGIAVPAALAAQPDLLIVAVEGDAVVGSILPGYDGHRGWLYAVAVLQSHRRQKIGTMLIREAEKRLQAMGCRKVNLQVRATNSEAAKFYERLGYAVEERISMGKRLQP